MRDGRRASGVEGRIVEPLSRKELGRLRVHANTVVLAAGCMQTPLLLERSEMGGAWVGKELQLHPGLAIMAVFDEPIDPWKGATQGYHSLEHLRDGIKLEVLWSPPAVLAARLPGLGRDYQQALAGYDRMAPFDVIIAADRSRGTVRAKRGSDEPDIKFDFDKRDVRLIQRGLGVLSDVCWASGCQSILPGLHGVPETLHSREESELLRTVDLDGQHTITAANHAFGSARMSARAEDGVVDTWGKVWDTEGLYVADTSVFAGSPAVNPMLTCMAIADRIALGIAQGA
jgi:choline dehydrogenase-like flavoprotein